MEAQKKGSRSPQRKEDKPMKSLYITVTGLDHYLGTKPFRTGRVVKLIKDEGNAYDAEAIRVELPFLDTVGHVANSTDTVYDGTASAGRVYDKIGPCAYARVLFITPSGVIAQILQDEDAEEPAAP
jgi:hypothetical protein